MGYTIRDYLTPPSLPSKQFFKTQLLHALYTTATIGGITICKAALNNIPYYYNLATNKVIENAPSWIIEPFGLVTVGFFSHLYNDLGTNTRLSHTTISLSKTTMVYGAYKFGTYSSDYLLNMTHVNEVSKKYIGEYGNYTADVIKPIVGITTATIFPANFIATKLATPVAKLEEFALTLYIETNNFICGKAKVDRGINTEHFQSVSENITPNDLTGVLDENTHMNNWGFVE